MMNIVEAVNDALASEMSRDERVLVLGEDVTSGGAFGATAQLAKRFGVERTVDTPIGEGGAVGAAIGLAMYGLRPVVEVQFGDFLYPAFDQIVNELAKVDFRSGGQQRAPVVIRAAVGGGVRGGPYHSQSPEAYFAHTPGLKVVAPSTPDDARGLLISAIRDDDPVLFFEPKRVYREVRSDVDPSAAAVPIGVARTITEGDDLTVLAWGAMVHEATHAVSQAEQEGISCDLIDLRTITPLDRDAIVASVTKTGRVVIAHEAPRTCGFGAELISVVNEGCFYSLEAPPVRVTGADAPVPYRDEQAYLPGAEQILDAIRTTADAIP